MKKVLLIISLVISIKCHAQVKGDNTILVTGVTFEQIVDSLLDHGFKIAKIDKEFHTVRTEFREPYKELSLSLYYDIRVKDSTAIITGKFMAGEFLEVIQKQKWGAWKYSFQAMNEFANYFKQPVTYMNKNVN